MSREMRRPLACAGLLLALLSAGCQQVYRSETVLHPDGSVERAIYQEAKDTPAEAQNPRLWKQTTFAPKPEDLDKQGYVGPIAHLPIHPAGKDLPYFAAWGEFKTVKEIPDHVVFSAPEGSGLSSGKLVRAYTRNDYLFVVEHRWRETLTDMVTLADMRRARDELADLVIDVLWDAFSAAVGDDYDASTLFQSLRGEGKTWLVELTDSLFVHCATHKTPGTDLALLDGLADICARHGLLLKKDGKLLEDEAAGKAIDDFVLGRLCSTVRHKASGKAVDRDTAAAWWHEFFNNAPKTPPPLLKPALEKVIATKYGGKEAFEQRAGLLLARVFGLHITDGLFHNQQFAYTLTVPGEVVETNARLLATNRVRWEFNAWEAYPLGFDMVCRSVEVRPEAQKELLRGQPLKSREAVLQFVDLATSLPGLGDALGECQHQHRLAPLYQYRLKVARNPKTPVKPVNDLLKLLGLPEQPPKE
jgi:hypothetical protein